MTAQIKSWLPSNDPQQFKRQTLTRACKLFLEKGFERTTIYTYYKSKQDLLAEVIEHAVVDLDLAWVQSAGAEYTTFERFFDRFSSQAHAIVSDPRRTQALRLLTKEGANVPGLVEHFVEAVWSKAGAAWTSVISQVMARGECRAMDARVVKRLIVALLFGRLRIQCSRGLSAQCRSDAELLQGILGALKLSLLPATEKQT